MEPKQKIETVEKEATQKAGERFRELSERPVIAEVIEHIRSTAPPNLTYHNASHAEGVLRDALLFAVTDNKLTDHEMELLAIAAAYHDIGYLQKSEGHEEIGAKIAAEAMQRHGYSAEDIKIVSAAILDTRLRQTEKGPKQISTSRIADYLLDADLGGFGQENYMEQAMLMTRELDIKNPRTFWDQSLKLFESHRWNTAAARRLRQSQKEKNIKKLKQALGVT